MNFHCCYKHLIFLSQCAWFDKKKIYWNSWKLFYLKSARSTAKLPNKINSLKVLSKKLKILDYFEFDEWMQILEMLKNF